MKKNLSNKFSLSCVIVLVLAMVITGCVNHDAAHQDTYTCPMHPTIVSDGPGTCPVCGMELVRKARSGEDVKITEDLSRLIQSPNEAVTASIQTIKPEFKRLPVRAEAVGVVTYDTRNIYSIPARVGGRIEKIYLKYEFETVEKGQKIAELYSPELITAQKELLFLVENDPEDADLIHTAKNKVLLLGLTQFQIKALLERKEVSHTFAVYSPYHGYLITDEIAPSASATIPQSPEAGGNGMNGMGGSASTPTPSPAAINAPGNPQSLLKEGNYVSIGQTLFKIVNTTALRIELNLSGTNAGAVKAGDEVELVFENDENELATIDLVQPFYTQGQNFLKVRISTKKTSNLHIGQLVRARINLESKESLWLPNEAVLDLGTEKIVFVKDRGLLKPKNVTTGMRSGDAIEITSGLASSDDIAANAHYLVDSESFIKPMN